MKDNQFFKTKLHTHKKPELGRKKNHKQHVEKKKLKLFPTPPLNYGQKNKREKKKGKNSGRNKLR